MVSPVKASSPFSAAVSSLVSSRWGWLPVLLLLGLALYFFRLGGVPLFDLDEPRYAEAAREMLESGHWITPTFNYELRFDKPVFFYWMIAGAYQVFGVNEFAARFWSAVTAIFTVLGLFAFARHWRGARFAWMAALVLSTCGLFIGVARMSITDMTLACFMSLTTLTLFMAAERDLRWWIVAGVITGLSLLTKGPVGIVLPGAVLLVYTIFTGSWKRVLLNRWLVFAVLIALAIAFPWYWACYEENGHAFLDALFFHNVDRYAGTVSGHDQPIWFYFAVLAGGGLPWSAWLPGATAGFIAQCRQHGKDWANAPIAVRLSLFAAVWGAFTVVFFTFAGTKLATYILPMFPALALFIAGWFEDVQEGWEAAGSGGLESAKPWSRRWLWFPAALLAVGVLVAGGLFMTQAERFLPSGTASVQVGKPTLAVFGLLTLALGVMVIFWRKRMSLGAVSLLAAGMTAAWVLALIFLMPAVSAASQSETLHYLERVGRNPLVIFEIQRPSLTFYGRRRIERFTHMQPEVLQRLVSESPRFYLITRPRHFKQLEAILPVSARLSVLEKGAVYSLLSIERPPSLPPVLNKRKSP